MKFIKCSYIQLELRLKYPRPFLTGFSLKSFLKKEKVFASLTIAIALGCREGRTRPRSQKRKEQEELWYKF